MSLLEVNDYDKATHTADPNRFGCRSVQGHVLLLDDTFTTGATSFSAARTLLSAGASHVSIVVIGRHAARDWGSGEYWDRVQRRMATGEFCPECRQSIGRHRTLPTSVGNPQGQGAYSDEEEPPDRQGWPEDPQRWTADPPVATPRPQRSPSPPVQTSTSAVVPAPVPAGPGLIKRGLKWIGIGVFAVVSVAIYIDQSTVSTPNTNQTESQEDPVRDSSPNRKAAIDLIESNATRYDMAGVPRGPIAEGIEYVCSDYIAEGRSQSEYESDMEGFATNDTARNALPFITYIGEVVYADSDNIC
ncbi:hypothetical protein ASE01_05625 [Nocardioides sp. Root190]|nr:hypothetical protein ASE01_05625 [Nocardioides sp. Root190]